MEFCAERGMCVGNKNLRKSTRMASSQDGVEVKSMIDLVKKDVRGMGRGISDHHVVLCKVRLVGTWIKRRVVNRARRIRSEELRKHQYREYARSLEGKRVEWDGENSVEHIWE